MQISEVTFYNINAIAAHLKEYGKQYPELLLWSTSDLTEKCLEHLKNFIHKTI